MEEIILVQVQVYQEFDYLVVAVVVLVVQVVILQIL